MHSSDRGMDTGPTGTMPPDHPRRCDHSRTLEGSQTNLNAALSSIPMYRRVQMISLEVRGDDGKQGDDVVAGSGEDADAETTAVRGTRNATLMASIRSSNYLAAETDSRRRGSCAVPAAIT